jgi:hypothetical protein
MSFTPANITALIVAASFAAGLNIYATVLTLGILARTQWVALPPGLESLGQTWVLVACAIMFAIEFVVDKIPAFDMAWNLLHTIVRVPIAALIAYNASSHLSPQMQILATAIGATIALATHTSKTAVRAAVTPSPEPISNIALSTSEDILAVGVTWFATHHPILAASAAIAFLVAGILIARALLRAIRRPIRRILHPDLDQPQKPPA